MIFKINAQPKDIEWRYYASDAASTKFSPASQVNSKNVKDLQVTWRWSSIDQPLLDADSTLSTWRNESTPLCINGVLYTSTSLSQVAAIDAATGKTLWTYNPGTFKNGRPPNLGFVHRGVTWWEHGNDKRIFIGTGDGYLVALNALTGNPVNSFGSNGRIDLLKGMRRPAERSEYSVTSPVIVCRDILIVGSAVNDHPHADVTHALPPGDIRGFDVVSGKQLWVFETVPQKNAFGNNTWLNNSAERAGNTNVWTWMSCDDKLGYVYLPVSTPDNDFYGGKRPGDNLFSESLVALNAKTGKRVWHFQMVHHGLWDYDLPCAPILLDIIVKGKKINAVAQISKQGFTYVFDRITGKPVWPIVERPVPAALVEGDQISATQPFPTKPLPFDKQGLTTDDLIDYTPELRQAALKKLSEFNYGPLFTPPSEKGTILLPGNVGGASWAGAAADPRKGLLFIPSHTLPSVVQLTKAKNKTDHYPYTGHYDFTLFLGPGRLPLIKGPYGRVTSIDLNSGDHVWMKPVGRGMNDHPLLKNLNLPPLGLFARNHVLLTSTLLFMGQEGMGTPRPSPYSHGLEMVSENLFPCLRAFDPATGELLAEIPLPSNASGAPMTYTLKGKQYIVVPIGGASQKAELVALSLAE